MAELSVFILLIFFESPDVFGMAFNTYCSLPCPMTNDPAPSTWWCTEPRQPQANPRPPVCDSYSDYDDSCRRPVLQTRSRQWSIRRPSYPNASPNAPIPERRFLSSSDNPDPSSDKQEPSPDKPEPSSPEDAPTPSRRSDSKSTEVRPKKNPCPSQRKFFTSLFSIPGAVVDTLLSGEIVI